MSIQANSNIGQTFQDNITKEKSFSEQVADVEVNKLSKKGEGIAFYNGFELYIKDVLPHEKLRVKIGEPFVKGSKRRPAEVIKVIEPSCSRNSNPECSHSIECGGCQYMHLKYEEQLKLKQQDILSALEEALVKSNIVCLPHNRKVTLSSDECYNTVLSKNVRLKAKERAALKANKQAKCDHNKSTTVTQPQHNAITPNHVNNDIDHKVTTPQLEAVNKLIENVLLEVESCEVRPCRFKSIRYFAMVDGVLKQGFYQPRSHQLVEIDNCHLEPASFSNLAISITEKLHKLGFKAYEDGLDNTKGEAESSSKVRALTLREGDEHKVLINLTVTKEIPQQIESAIAEWANEHRGLVHCLYVSINDREGNALFSDNFKLLYGQEFLPKTLLNYKYLVGPNTFLQVNYDICEKLYKKAVVHCANVKDALPQDTSLKLNALDLCCGAGTMSLPLSACFDEVLGIEIVEAAIKAARENAKLNNLSNVSFVAGDISEHIPKALQDFNCYIEHDVEAKQALISDKHNSEGSELKHHIAAVIADPPRVGLGEQNVKALAKLKAPVNVSLIFCALSALKRDLPYLLEHGYSIKEVQGFDMFPHSNHVETLVLLTKR